MVSHTTQERSFQFSWCVRQLGSNLLLTTLKPTARHLSNFSAVTFLCLNLVLYLNLIAVFIAHVARFPWIKFTVPSIRRASSFHRMSERQFRQKRPCVNNRNDEARERNKVEKKNAD
jgi:hypothetical protein